jgi:hypothetical protein
MPRLTQPKEGQLLEVPARGFPCFYGKKRKKRVITGDVWAFLHHIGDANLVAADAGRAHSFIDQASDFYSAASNPRQASRPLLYYYAFLNLAKVFLTHKSVAFPPAVKHGISDPKANKKERLHFKTQVVRVPNHASDHGELLPELIKHSGGGCNLPTDFKVLELLGQIPAIHRTYCEATGSVASFCPVKSLELRRTSDEVWAVLTLRKHDRDVKSCLPGIKATQRFSSVFTQVTASSNDVAVFESGKKRFRGRGLDGAIGRLASDVKKCGFLATLTDKGYVHYLAAFEDCLPQICVPYAVVFYLGSITRYKPYDYSKIVKGFSWLLSEFLDTQPMQMLYLTASMLAETEVVVPHAKGMRHQVV